MISGKALQFGSLARRLTILPLCLLLGYIGLPILPSSFLVHATENRCGDSKYQYEFLSNAANLRWSLFALSQLSAVGKTDRELLKDLADGATISLANTLSLRASFVSTCGDETEAYLRDLRTNENFARVLLDITSSEEFPAAQYIQDKHPNFVLWSSPQTVLQNAALPPFARVISERLVLLQADVHGYPQNPYFIATSQLLGQSSHEPFDEKKVTVLPIVPVNSAGNFYKKFHKESSKELLANLHKQDSFGLLEDLRTYYSPVSKISEGIPQHLLVRQ